MKSRKLEYAGLGLLIAVSLSTSVALATSPSARIQVDVVNASSATASNLSLRHALTRSYVQDRTMKWALHQALLLAQGQGGGSETHQVDSLLKFIDRYLAQPAQTLRPNTLEELRSWTDQVLQAPLLIEDEMRKVLEKGDLPPRFEIDDSLLSEEDARRAHESLSSFDLKMTVRPLATSWFAFGPLRDLGRQTFSVFESLADSSADGRKFRERVRALSPDIKTQFVETMIDKVNLQIGEAMKKAEELVAKIQVNDPVLNRFLQVFLGSYLKSLPRPMVIQVAAHLIQYGYPLDRLPQTELMRLVLERSGPTALKIVQSAARSSKLKPEMQAVFKRFETDGPAVPVYFLQPTITALTPAGARLEIDPAPVGRGSLAQVHSGFLTEGTQRTRVASRFIKPGIRDLFASEAESLKAAVAAVEADPELAQSRFGHLRMWVDDLTLLIKTELDATSTATKQRLAHQVYQETYQGNDGWTFSFHVPDILGSATSDGMIQEWAGGVDYDSFLASHPEARSPFHLMLMRHFFKEAMEGHVHGDVHPGNLKIEVDEAQRTVRTSILDFGMFETLPIEIRQGALRVLTGLQMESPEMVAQGLARLQDTQRSRLGMDELQTIVNTAFQNESQKGLERLGTLSRGTLEGGYAMPIPAAALIRSMISLRNATGKIDRGQMLDMMFKQVATGDLSSLTEMVRVADISLEDVQAVTTSIGRALFSGLWGSGRNAVTTAKDTVATTTTDWSSSIESFRKRVCSKALLPQESDPER